MLPEEIKAILSRPEAGRTEEEKNTVSAHILNFAERIKEVCTEFGLVHQATLKVDKQGIRPSLEIVVYEPVAATPAPDEKTAQ
jgi:transposase-like protein